jgi:hypothetical protein
MIATSLGRALVDLGRATEFAGYEDTCRVE